LGEKKLLLAFLSSNRAKKTFLRRKEVFFAQKRVETDRQRLIIGDEKFFSPGNFQRRRKKVFFANHNFFSCEKTSKKYGKRFFPATKDFKRRKKLFFAV
jgi:hypothetical protein